MVSINNVRVMGVTHLQSNALAHASVLVDGYGRQYADKPVTESTPEFTQPNRVAK